MMVWGIILEAKNVIKNVENRLEMHLFGLKTLKYFFSTFLVCNTNDTMSECTCRSGNTFAHTVISGRYFQRGIYYATTMGVKGVGGGKTEVGKGKGGKSKKP